MKSLFLCLMLTPFLLSMACGGGDEGGIDPSESVARLDFSGDWELRDHSCTYDPIKKMSIGEPGPHGHVDPITGKPVPAVLIIVGDPGEGGFYKAGDIFFAELTASGAVSKELGCEAYRVETEEEAKKGTEILRVDFERGDLEAICNDPASADSICYLSYKLEP